jgi:hypothetical protein
MKLEELEGIVKWLYDRNRALDRLVVQELRRLMMLKRAVTDYTVDRSDSKFEILEQVLKISDDK